MRFLVNALLLPISISFNNLCFISHYFNYDKYIKLFHYFISVFDLIYFFYIDASGVFIIFFVNEFFYKNSLHILDVIYDYINSFIYVLYHVL